MPASLFAARCLYVAQQPLQYRRDVIRRMFNARAATHAALFVSVGLPGAVQVADTQHSVPLSGALVQKQMFHAFNPF